MPELSCGVEAIEVVRHAAEPTLGFRIRIVNALPTEPVAAITLQCQVRIEATRRRYATSEQEALGDLFGRAELWSRGLRSLLWTHASASVPAFTEGCSVELPVACSFDFNVAATQYFDAIEDGEIPLSLHFSGTVFFHDADGRLQVSRIPWTTEARAALPAATWRALMARYHPNSVWLALPRPLFDRLRALRLRTGAVSWERALEQQLDAAEKGAATADPPPGAAAASAVAALRGSRVGLAEGTL